MTHEPLTASVGIVTPQHVRLFGASTPLQLDGGTLLHSVDVSYETYGTLNQERSNAVLICHALSGNAHAAGYHSKDDKRPGWWDHYIGPGKPFDTNRYFVIASNNLGGCDGTTGPSSIDPATGMPYGLNFPMITIGDIVRVQHALVRQLGIERLMAVVGGSMGGMQALQWALDYPHMVPASVIIAAAPRLTAQNIAFNAVARQAIMADPHFNGGDYYTLPGDPTTKARPESGLALARMMAHITYLSEQGLHERFGRRLQDRDALSYGFETDFAVESYLSYQGSSFVKRFDANSYLYITKAMDYFDPFPDAETTVQRLTGVESHFLVMSFDTDWRFDTSRSKELVRILHRSLKDCTFQEFSSPAGHDAFLLPHPSYEKSLGSFLLRTWQSITGGQA
ncbi:homoserine O-acetyltransferase [Magnetococcus marinus MC-1]|uniref:Homoserine O-succinyltransferase n=1 Tax=Magnetococcus marinus (strain ATCC BAA-1437 / JCM 17883 / MC-1) TaxID=156889 RepID=METXS_MAGMM|nr:homoserine O-acetyltransferase [Magnetococcus marinus]A0LCI7.1 RecName: Full=Homoserine O-succinyltransferase; Short=HST; AltName: Full=Homoserine transsuccinylase; Short=HTS [Magnetococcus marinus MC-1]ABK45680.1 homoserine O-acetyltransferase [Magnetococcus marinus MC-1]